MPTSIIRMRYTVVFFMLMYLCLPQNMQAQTVQTTKNKKAIKQYKAAIASLNKLDHEAARKSLCKALDEVNSFAEAYLLLAESYTETQEYEKAISNYALAHQHHPNFFAMSYKTQGDLELMLGHYVQAQKSYNGFLQYETSQRSRTAFRSEVAQKLANCKFAINALNNPLAVTPINMGDGINSEMNEYWPCVTADDQTLIYTVLTPRDPNHRHRNPFNEELFAAYKTNNRWGVGRNLGPEINTIENEGASFISVDGETILFTGCSLADGYGNCDLYRTYRDGHTWKHHENLGKLVNSRFKDSQPCLSADGLVLYFSSNRPGGIGGMDIWQCSKDSLGQWMAPSNLGEPVNTKLDEQGPFMHPDGQTLYFASQGHLGMGGDDVFLSKLQADGSWSEPQNIGYPINQYRDESDFRVNAAGTKAYFSSVRDGGLGGMDIYEVELPPAIRPKPVSYAKGTVSDAISKLKLQATVELIDIQQSKTIAKVTSNKATGHFLVCLPADREYALNVSKKGYLFYSQHFELQTGSTRTKPYELIIELQPILPGKSMVLNNVFFATNSWKLEGKSETELKKVVGFLLDNPTVNIEIGGHTDNMGKETDNQILSENRAKAVREYLLTLGIAAERVSYKGYGAAKPIAANDSDEGKAQNRRTEFIILKQ